MVWVGFFPFLFLKQPSLINLLERERCFLAPLGLRYSTWEEELPKSFQIFASLALPSGETRRPLGHQLILPPHGCRQRQQRGWRKRCSAGERGSGAASSALCSAVHRHLRPPGPPSALRGTERGRREQGGDIPGETFRAAAWGGGGKPGPFYAGTGWGLLGNGQRHFPQPFPSGQHQGERKSSRPAPLSPRPAAPRQCREELLPPCRGHLLASSPEIPTPIPVALRRKSPHVPQTGRRRPGLGA